MKITPVTPTTAAASLPMITAAFLTAAHSDGTEAALVTRLRQSPTYRADRDIVAVTDDGQVVGHAMLSTAQVVNDAGQAWPVQVLAPLSVAPDFQGQGLGSALLNYLIVQAGEDQVRAISILGDPGYYGRFGFGPASEFAITAPMPDVAPFFLIRPLRANGLAGVHGVLQYDAAFGL